LRIQPADEIGCPSAIHQLYGAQHADRKGTYDGIMQNFQAVDLHALAIWEKSGSRDQDHIFAPQRPQAVDN
jgi:hypothetical protein